jgi:hypothetical protein
MNKELEQLYLVFHIDSDEIFEVENEDKEFKQLLSEVIDDNIPEGVMPLRWVIDKIYEEDKVLWLIDLFDSNSIDYDLDYLDSEFEEGDWTEYPDEETKEMIEENYGEEGYTYYYIYTKTKVHTFSKMEPLRSDTFEYSNTKDK